MDIKNIWVTPKLLSFLKFIQCIAVNLTTRNRVLPKFILRRAKRLFPWWLVGTPYASESDLVRWWWLLWSWLWSFHILRNLIKVNGIVVVAPLNEVFCRYVQSTLWTNKLHVDLVEIFGTWSFSIGENMHIEFRK